jgi:MSHA pilin protein MshD
MIELLMFIVIVGIAVAGVLSVLDIATRNSADPQLRKQALAIAEGVLEEVQMARFTYCHPSAINAETATGAKDCAPDTVAVTNIAACPTVEWISTNGSYYCRTNEVIGPLAGETRPYLNVNDYARSLNVPNSLTPGDDSGLITDAAGARYFTGKTIDANGNARASAVYTAKVTIKSASVFGPATMPVPAVADPVNPADTNVLHISVDVTYGNNEHVVLEAYRTRYAPRAVP